MESWLIGVLVGKFILLALLTAWCCVRRRRSRPQLVNVQTESGEAYAVPAQSLTCKGYVAVERNCMYVCHW